MKVRKAVITAAGRGTRMYPASQSVQKELFPLVDTDGYAKPTLQIIVEEALASDIEEVCIVANPANAEPIRKHFIGLNPQQRAMQFRAKRWAEQLSDDLERMAQQVTVVVQEHQEGYGHAVFQAREWVGNEPCVVLLGDHVYRSYLDSRCTRQAVMVYEQFQDRPVASVVPKPDTLLHRLGIVRGEPIENRSGIYNITAMAEKPSLEYAQQYLQTAGLPVGNYLCFFGIHVFPPEIFDCLELLIRNEIRLRGEFQLTSAQELLLQDGRYIACLLQGERYDMGVPEGLIETQIALALHSPFRQNVLDLLHQHEEYH